MTTKVTNGPANESTASGFVICRICHSGESSGPFGSNAGDPLFRFCNCIGSTALCHHSCLKKWVENNHSRCEMCRTYFNVEIYRPTFNTYFHHKKFIRERRELRRDFLYFLLLTPLAVTAVVLCLTPLVRAIYKWEFEGQEISFVLAACSIVVAVCYIVWLKKTLRYNYWNYLDFIHYFENRPRVKRVVPLNYVTNHPKSKKHIFTKATKEAPVHMVSDALLPLTESHSVKTARCWFCHLVDIVPDERQSVAYPSGYVLYRACRCKRYCHFRCLLRHKRIRKCPTCNDDFLGKSDAIQGRVHFEVCRICNLTEFMDGQGGTADDKKLVRPCRCMTMAHHGCASAVIDKQPVCRVCGERTAYSTYGNFFHFAKRYPFYVGIPILVYTVILGFAAYFIRDLCMTGIGNMRESLILAGATAGFIISTVIFFYWIVYTASVRMPIFKKRYGHVSVYDFKVRGYTSVGNDSKTTSHLTTELSRGFSADSFKATSTPRRSPGSLTAQLVDLESPVSEEAVRKSTKFMITDDDLEGGLKTPKDSDLDSIPLDVPVIGTQNDRQVLFNSRMGSIQSFHSNRVATVMLSDTTDPPSSSLDIITQHPSRPV